ncbi:MAG: alpha/beta fold hydrolase [Ardenticatenales bacterium]|nr:alpha/beta fold hydrolase [Ardenticatenales bacterium]
MKATIHGSVMHYESYGAGEPLLFIHGFPLSGELWMPLIPLLQEEYRLIIPDLRGFGQSDLSQESSMGQYVEDLATLLDLSGEQRPVVLVGLSMGGYIAFEFYRRYPERIRALVLSDTRAPADSEEGARGRLATAERVLREGSAGFAEEMTGKLFAPQATEELRQQWREIMTATAPESIAAALRAMAERPDSTETLATINRPTLILVGEEDKITPLADAQAMQKAITGAELEAVPAAGHMPPVEQPECFAARLLQFLDNLDPLDQQGWPYRPDPE